MGVDSLRGSSPSPRPEPVTSYGKTSRLPPSPAPSTGNTPTARPANFEQSRFDPAGALPSMPSLFQSASLSKQGGFDQSRFDAAGRTAGVPDLFQSTPLSPTPEGFTPPTNDPFTVPQGQMTFDAEGLEDRGRYFSREAHWPGGASGVTIGRGYDMKERTQEEVLSDLTAAGVPQADAERLSQGAGLSGADASKFLDEVEGLEITPEAQQSLFSTVYDEHAADVQRISNKADVVEAYGATDWENLDPAIQDALVDLRYRGDYTGATRKEIQPLVVANDLQGLHDLLADEDKMVNDWGVPPDRFARRRDALADALADRAAQQPAQ